MTPENVLEADEEDGRSDEWRDGRYI